MLRSLLSERFKLKAHYETHERPVYALVLARADRLPAGALVRSTIDCEAFGAALREGRRLDVPNPSNGADPCAWTSSEGPGSVIVRVGGLPLAVSGRSLAPM
jgi:hypothetical protein